MADGRTPLFRDLGSTRKIAKQAVKKVYQHVSSPKDAAFVEQRTELALQFRQKYHSDVSGAANVNPYFIGVFDTVAALGSYLFSAALIVLAVAILTVIAYLQSIVFFSFLPVFLWSVGIAFVIGIIWYAVTHVQYAVGLPGYSFFQTLHFTAPKMQFYDKHLDNAVWYARHAMSIDENRADFARVPWGSTQNKGPPRPDSYPDWLDQICLQAFTQTLAAATQRTSRDCPTSHWCGWSMLPRISPTATRRMPLESRSIDVS